MTILDAMILAAAFAMGFTAVKSWHRVMLEGDRFRWESNGSIIADETALVVYSLTVAVIPLRLVRPRPTLGRLCLQPGFQASVAACLALLIGGCGHAFNLLPPWDNPTGRANFLGYVDPLFLVGPAVLLAWVALALSGRWRAEPSWVDRLGRFLGATWLVAYAVYEYCL